VTRGQEALKMDEHVNFQLDVCGVCCPLPLIELAKAAAKLSPGQVIEVTGNDPIFKSSVLDFCRANGHSVLEVRKEADHRISIKIQIGPAA
jgi:TusA-related sulfurtransferase